MTGEQWRRAKPVLTAALGLDRAERDRLLRSAFEEEGELRAHVAAVLRDHDAVSSRLRAAAFVVSTHLRSGDISSGEFEALLARDAESSAPFLEPGESCGPYRVVRQLGLGGMGQVYLAEDTTLGTAVALKFVAPRWLGSPAAAARLRQEAARAAQLRFHPNIATVLHFTELELKGRSVAVLVMEYVSGSPATQLLSEGPLDAKQAIASVIEVTRAMEFAHGKGILHCDIKPANLLIHEAAAGREVKVVDFGIARALSIGGVATAGTVPYMPPELLASGECGVATDIYALGVTLFELVTKQRPYRGDIDELILDIAGAPVPSASAFVSGLPAGLDEVLQRAMAKAPEERFPSMTAFRSALEALEPLPIVSVPVSWWRAGAGGALGITVLITALGFVTSLALDQGLGRTSRFTLSALVEWLYWGARSMVAPVVVGALALVAGVCLAGIGQLLWRALNRPPWLEDRLAVIRLRCSAVDMATWSQLLLLVHVGVIVGLVLYFRRLLAGFMDFMTKAQTSLEVLGPSYEALQGEFGYLVTLELLIFGFAWWKVLRARTRRGETGGSMYVAGGIVAIVLTLCFFSMRFRIISHNYLEQVAYGEATCYLSEDRGSEALLFCPQAQRRRIVVPVADVRRTGQHENIFSSLKSSND